MLILDYGILNNSHYLTHKHKPFETLRGIEYGSSVPMRLANLKVSKRTIFKHRTFIAMSAKSLNMGSESVKLNPCLFYKLNNYTNF